MTKNVRNEGTGLLTRALTNFAEQSARAANDLAAFDSRSAVSGTIDASLVGGSNAGYLQVGDVVVGTGAYSPEVYSQELLRAGCEVHQLTDEVELDDGRIHGRCASCGERIVGRRLAGGFGLPYLRAAIVDAIGDHEAMADLLEEIERVELMLELEEQSIEGARKLIQTAKRMMETVLT